MVWKSELFAYTSQEAEISQTILKVFVSDFVGSKASFGLVHQTHSVFIGELPFTPPITK
ncbi:MAG: hypothetical protein LBC61_05780 [Candidatus Peribacteria bacterium]|jgi:hypothetical protein|nr:hypothetical protein [Candidatus Peribacteria bacterium]